MGQIPEYKKIDQKNKFFKRSSGHPNNKIDTIAKFNSWYNLYSNRTQQEGKRERYFFRGVTEAKWKLFSSAQRIWLTTEIGSWKTVASYEDFIQKFIAASKKEPLFKRVFDFYKALEGKIDFPMLSIIQHYGAPTPLIDWTYDFDIALYFATENISSGNNTTEIDNYFSMYIINKERTEIQSLSSVDTRAYPTLKKVFEKVKLSSSETGKLFYLSDYERDNIKEPLTTIYNQNIIPQKGLFIFNPSPTKPLEEYFNREINHDPDMTPFMCYNIKKDLAEYIRRKIALKGVIKGLVYPEVKNCCNQIKENVLNSYFKLS